MNRNNKTALWAGAIVLVLALTLLGLIYFDKTIRSDIEEQAEWLDSNVVSPDDMPPAE